MGGGEVLAQEDGAPEVAAGGQRVFLLEQRLADGRVQKRPMETVGLASGQVLVLHHLALAPGLDESSGLELRGDAQSPPRLRDRLRGLRGGHAHRLRGEPLRLVGWTRGSEQEEGQDSAGQGHRD